MASALKPMMKTSEKTIGRLSLYRRVLLREQSDVETIFSHELAALTGGSAAQVRRDIMALGYEGNPNRGYDRAGLIDSISRCIDAPYQQKMVLAGVGHLGRALMNYFAAGKPGLNLTAAFDIDTTKVGRVIHGVRCYPIEEMELRTRETGADLAILTLPAFAAQDAAQRLIAGGVHGIVSFAPLNLQVPEDVHLTILDITTAVETAAFFSRSHTVEHS